MKYKDKKHLKAAASLCCACAKSFTGPSWKKKPNIPPTWRVESGTPTSSAIFESPVTRVSLLLASFS